MAVDTECIPTEIPDWYEALRDEVEYHCSFCEGAFQDAGVLLEKVKLAFAHTARSMKGVYDAEILREHWYGMWLFASEIHAVAQSIQQSHQICGVDIQPFQQFSNAAWERFTMHCPRRLAA